MKYVVMRNEFNGMWTKIGEGENLHEALEIRENDILNGVSVSSIKILKEIKLLVVELDLSCQ